MPTEPTPTPTLSVTPHGRVATDSAAPGARAWPEPVAALLAAGDDATALVELAARQPDEVLEPTAAWFRDFARALLAAAAAAPSGIAETPAPPFAADARAEEAPPLLGREYVDGAFVAALWGRLGEALRSALAREACSLEEWLHARHEAWRVVGRVCFHLAENRKDPERPFAFLATYTVGLGAGARAQHRPLGQALQESAASRDRAGLLRLLEPVHRAAGRSAFVRSLVESNAVFRPQPWTAREAHAFLRDVPALEVSGVVVRVPDWWRPKAPPRVTADVRLGATLGPAFDAQGLVSFDVALALDGEPLSEEEWQRLRAAGDGLVPLRGRWVEVDRARLDEVLSAWRAAQDAARGGVPFHEAMRLLAGVDRPRGLSADEAAEPGWSRVSAGPALENLLARMRSAGAGGGALPGTTLRATLRPYQQDGVRWLGFLNGLGLGACLADDMGLGKTIQVLSLLLVLKERGAAAQPHLLVAPASLLGNWRAEAERFAPSLRVRLAHASGDGVEPAVAEGADLVVTTYGTVARVGWLRERRWDTLVLDEAQAIKNPGTKQTRAVKALDARVRLALSGTPVENRAGDLWSLFDVLQPGLLGSAAEFRRLEQDKRGWAPVRALVAPYLLRRLKTDPKVAPDLPEKTELVAECGLSPEQAALYARTVEELARTLAQSDGIARRGAVLSALLRLKQICNHPSHWLGDGGWEEARSGKLLRLAELVEPVAARQEKALVFTQFREAVEPLAAVLARQFGREGLVLHGDTPIKRRRELVDRFQDDDRVPFMVLSLKAGGTGLTLTAATHVVHFDRWWNPAVEDQATDRAFRIGQKRAVFVHKLVCRGTLEEKVDAMIRAKRGLARDLLSGEDEVRLTELSDDELLKIVSLDLGRSRVET